MPGKKSPLQTVKEGFGGRKELIDKVFSLKGSASPAEVRSIKRASNKKLLRLQKRFSAGK
jgi:hypothetical protein